MVHSASAIGKLDFVKTYSCSPQKISPNEVLLLVKENFEEKSNEEWALSFNLPGWEPVSKEIDVQFFNFLGPNQPNTGFLFLKLKVLGQKLKILRIVTIFGEKSQYDFCFLLQRLFLFGRCASKTLRN